MNNLQDPLQNREKYIGSSDAPIVMGVSPWKTRYELFMEKLGFGKPNMDNYAMAMGRQREDEARTEFERQTGLTMFSKIIYHEEHEFIRASLDGITLEQDAALEIKCPGKVDHETAMNGLVPDKYTPQLQHQLFTTGLDMVYYFSYTPESNNIIQVYRDERYIDKMWKEHCEFWECVQDAKPPELCDRDYVEKNDDFWLAVEKQWKSAKNELKTAEEKEKSLRETLISMASNHNCRGLLTKLTRITRKGNIDYAAIPELQYINLEKYRKPPTEYWKIGDVK